MSSSLPSHHPFYTLGITVAGCAYEILVNDVPVFFDKLGNPGMIEVPINLWLRNGKNVFQLKLSPMPQTGCFDEGTVCEAIVFCRPKSGSRLERVEVTKIVGRFSQDEVGASSGAKLTNQSMISIQSEAEVCLEIPWDLWPWMQSVSVQNLSEARSILVSQVRFFHGLLQEKNLEGILQMLQRRDDEYALAYSIDRSLQKIGTRREFSALVHDSRLQLAPFEDKDLSLRVFGNGRLLCIEAPDGESPIYYYDSDAEIATYLPLVFMQCGTGNWEVCR